MWSRGGAVLHSRLRARNGRRDEMRPWTQSRDTRTEMIGEHGSGREGWVHDHRDHRRDPSDLVPGRVGDGPIREHGRGGPHGRPELRAGTVHDRGRDRSRGLGERRHGYRGHGHAGRGNRRGQRRRMALHRHDRARPGHGRRALPARHARRGPLPLGLGARPPRRGPTPVRGGTFWKGPGAGASPTTGRPASSPSERPVRSTARHPT